MTELAAYGCDGIIAKLADEPYHSGDRDAMVKVKRMRTADCVAGGFRYATKKENGVGSILLGLYNETGKLDHVGFCSSFNAAERRELLGKLEPLRGGVGFTGKAPGGPSRWTKANDRSTEWEPLEPKLVLEVRYDHFSGGRFRHGTKFLRWRPDKAPRQCTTDQVRVAGPRKAA
jgi:ATP-dependent DNA ligase